MDQDIKAVWTQVLKGDHDAWRRLVRRYAALVHSVATGVGLSSTDAEDCGQQTWMALYKNRKAIKDPLGLPAWLIRTTRRRAVRTAQRLSRMGLAEPDDHFEDTATLPDEAVIQLERQVILEQALRQLEPRCGHILEALFFSPAEKSYREIARELGVSPNTLGPLRMRCLKKLKDILKKMGYSLH